MVYELKADSKSVMEEPSVKKVVFIVAGGLTMYRLLNYLHYLLLQFNREGLLLIAFSKPSRRVFVLREVIVVFLIVDGNFQCHFL